MKKLLFISLISYTQVFAGVERLQSVRINKAQVQRLYLAPGLGSILTFPCSIQEAFLGRSEDLKAQISPNDKRVLFLNLKLNSSLPTNVIVKCFPERNIFVFDVIPNKSKHQDLVEVRGSYGTPKRTDLIVESVQPKFSKIVIKKPVLIGKGAR